MVRITQEVKNAIANTIEKTIKTERKHGMLLCEDRGEIILGEIGIEGARCPYGRPILSIIIDRV